MENKKTMTIQELADSTGIAHSTIHRYLKDDLNIDLDKIEKNEKGGYLLTTDIIEKVKKHYEKNKVTTYEETDRDELVMNYLREHGLTLEEWCEKNDLNRSSVWKFRKHKGQQVNTLKQIAKALNKDLSDII